MQLSAALAESLEALKGCLLCKSCRQQATILLFQHKKSMISGIANVIVPKEYSLYQGLFEVWQLYLHNLTSHSKARELN